MDKEQILEVLNKIRDDCFNTEYCEYCPYSCTYYVSHNDVREERHGCVLNNAPEHWQLETMEGFYDGEES